MLFVGHGIGQSVSVSDFLIHINCIFTVTVDTIFLQFSFRKIPAAYTCYTLHLLRIIILYFFYLLYNCIYVECNYLLEAFRI